MSVPLAISIIFCSFGLNCCIMTRPIYTRHAWSSVTQKASLLDRREILGLHVNQHVYWRVMLTETPSRLCSFRHWLYLPVRVILVSTFINRYIYEQTNANETCPSILFHSNLQQSYPSHRPNISFTPKIISNKLSTDVWSADRADDDNNSICSRHSSLHWTRR